MVLPTSPVRLPYVSTWRQKPPLGTRLDMRHPLTQGLEGCYLLNEGQGDYLYDLTGNGHDVFVGMTTNNVRGTHARWVHGRYGGFYGHALELLSDGGVNNTNLVRPYTKRPLIPWAFECWLLRRAGFAEGVLLSGTGNLARLRTMISGAGFLLQWQDNLATRSNNSVLRLDEWHHIVVTMNMYASSQSLLHRVVFYVNGRRDGSSNAINSSTSWDKLFNRNAQECLFVGDIGLLRIWMGRDLVDAEVADLYANPFGMFQHPTVFVVAQLPPLQPAQIQWQAQAVRIANRTVRVEPTRLSWQALELLVRGAIEHIEPVMLAWRTFGMHRAMQVVPAQIQWEARQARLPIGLLIRDCGDAFEAEVQKTSLLGDWLVQAPDIGLFVAANFEQGGLWEHRLVDIADIEISAPPGGGIASAANVTISIAESGSGQSILQLWQAASAVEAVEVTIDFYLPTIDQALRMFTGHIDSIVVKDSIAQILCVDESIRKNFAVPKQLVKREDFPNADQASITKVIPLVYGQGEKIGGAPLLLVDVVANNYLVAAHPMALGGSLAIYDQPTNTFLLLESVLFIPNNGNASITLGTVHIAGMESLSGLQVTNPTFAVDGNSTTLAVVGTNQEGPWDSFVSTGDGWGAATWSPSALGYPLAGTVQITLTNHRRSPGSDPTTSGRFLFRTVNREATVELRRFMVTPAFRQVTSAQTDVFILSNTNIGANELFNILLVARCEGTISNTSQSYEIGEVSITPLVAFSANVSGTVTGIGLPVNVQELRFNRQRPTLSVFFASGVTTATNAIDGNSTTLALISTSGLDSNLDGIGELIVATVGTSALRANNTVAIDLARHRRALTSDPTVTGTFSIQTYNTVTGAVLRDNLLVTQAFRHTTYPQVTSYTATGVNLGTNAQVAVRVVARNEGGAGNANQYYEVGEIGIESYYQPRGDSADVFLYGTGYEGRTDVDGTVTSYMGTLAGRLYQTPEQVIASMVVEEMLAPIDITSFNVAHDFYAGYTQRFDGGIGAGWAVEQAPIREILDSLAKQSTAILFPNFLDTWEIRPFRSDTLEHLSFDERHILTEQGSEQARPEDRNSTMQITLGDLKNVYNHIEVRFKYNAGSRKYDQVWKVTKDGSNFTEDILDKALIEQTAYESWLRYGDLEPLIVEANWIACTCTAGYLLRHLMFYFAQQRITLQFEVTFEGMCLQVGDFIRVTEATIPAGDNGQLFEVHRLRYMPFKGRIQITCSRVATLQDVTIPDPPAALVGCARFAAHATLTQGLTACWDFAESDGTRTDHISGLQLFESGSVPRGEGKVGYCCVFDAAAETTLYNTNLLMGHFLGNFTMAFWVRLRSVPASPKAIITNISGPTGDTSELEWSIYLYGVGNQYVYTTFHNATVSTNATAPLPFTGTDTDWTLVFVWKTIDTNGDGRLNLQLNQDTIYYTDFTSVSMVMQNAFCVGANMYGDGSFDAWGDFLLGPLMIWSRVLSTDERAAVWNSGTG